MVVYESDCCDCQIPCIYESCQFWRIARPYCDECGNEVDVLYYFDGQELCLDCVEERLERVEIDD